MAQWLTVLAAPLYLALIALELWVDKKRGTGHYRLNDAIGSISLGVISRTQRLVLYTGGALLVTNLLPAQQLIDWDQHTALAWIVAFVGYDLTYYWNHRLNHAINCLWAGHVVHHQSEDYNLSTALRQTSGGVFDWIFSIPLLLTGIPVDIIVASAGLNLIYQFWVHTQHIDKLGIMERFMVTPSHHRVHHAQNPLYWDRNYGGVLIVWDRLFGSFQAERADTPIVYGVSRPLHTLNPLKANLQVWWYLLRDALYCQSWWDKLRIWFMPTGWRPVDMAARLPIAKSDLAQFHKYDPQVAAGTQAYALFQLSAGFLLGICFIFTFAELDYGLRLAGWLFITSPLITAGQLLDGGHWRWEWARLAASVAGVTLAWPLMAASSAWLFGGYLAANGVALAWLALWPRAAPQAQQA